MYAKSAYHFVFREPLSILSNRRKSIEGEEGRFSGMEMKRGEMNNVRRKKGRMKKFQMHEFRCNCCFCFTSSHFSSYSPSPEPIRQKGMDWSCMEILAVCVSFAVTLVS
jgi:hypothetical protein